MDSQKELWKQDAKQLKEDLKKKKTTIQRREVPIQFGGVKPANTSVPTPPPLSNPHQDDALRKQLGL